MKAYQEKDYASRNIINDLYPYMDYSYPAFKELMKHMRKNYPIILQKTRQVVRTVPSNVHVTSNFNECRDLVETLILYANLRLQL